MKNFKIFLLILVIASSFVFTVVVNAGIRVDSKNEDLADARDNLFSTGSNAGFDVSTDLYGVIAAIAYALISLLGIVFILLMVYGGYLWMTAKGNEERVEKSKKLIIAAILGLVVVLSAYVISYFIISNIASSTINL